MFFTIGYRPEYETFRVLVSLRYARAHRSVLALGGTQPPRMPLMGPADARRTHGNSPPSILGGTLRIAHVSKDGRIWAMWLADFQPPLNTPLNPNLHLVSDKQPILLAFILCCFYHLPKHFCTSTAATKITAAMSKSTSSTNKTAKKATKPSTHPSYLDMIKVGSHATLANPDHHHHAYAMSL